MSAALLLLLAACDEGGDGANGTPCLRHTDCASDYCVATLCQARPTLGRDASGGSAGAE